MNLGDARITYNSSYLVDTSTYAKDGHENAAPWVFPVAVGQDVLGGDGFNALTRTLGPRFADLAGRFA